MINIIVFALILPMVLLMVRGIFSNGAGTLPISIDQYYKNRSKFLNGANGCCLFCKHYYHYSGPMQHRCYGRKKRVDNLKSFPFKTKQKCFKSYPILSIYKLGE